MAHVVTLIDTVNPQLPHGHCLLAYDCLQKLKRPMGLDETRTMWHHTAKSSAAKPQVQMTFFLFLTDVVAEASSLMPLEALNAAKVTQTGVLQL